MLTTYSDIIKGLIKSGGRFGDFFNTIDTINSGFLDSLQTDEQAAGHFICNVLAGDIPDALGGIASQVVSEAGDDLSAVTAFIGGLPTLVPEVFSAIEQDGQEAVSVIGDIVTNPGAAVTLVVNGVESVVDDIGGDIETAVGDIASFFACLGGGCVASPTASSLPGAGGILQSMCANIERMTPGQTVTTTTQAFAQPTANSSFAIQSPSLRNSVQPTATTPTMAPAPVSGQTGHGEREHSQTLWIWGGSLACVFAVMIFL